MTWLAEESAAQLPVFHWSNLKSHLSNFCHSSTDWFKGNIYRKPWFLHFLPSIIGVYCRFSQQQCILGLTLVPGNESLTYKDLSLGHLRTSTSMLSGDEARNWFNRHIQEKHALTSWRHDFYMVLPSHVYTFYGNSFAYLQATSLRGTHHQWNFYSPECWMFCPSSFQGFGP